MHDINDDKAPANMLNLFKKSLIFTHTIHDRPRLESSMLKGSRLEIQNNSFSRLAVKLWNKIPSYVTDIQKKAFNEFSANYYLIS